MVKNARFDVHRVSRTSSTQDVVRRAALAGAADGYCCVADEQTAGRGRLGRSWIAPPHTSLLTSVLLRPSGARREGVPFAAGLAVVDAVSASYNVTARLKWPNDVLVDGRKLAGLLVEALAPASRDELAVVVGLGMNLTVPAFPDGLSAISLHEVASTVPERDRILSAWLRALDARMQSLHRDGLSALLDEWRRHAFGLGEPVTVATPTGDVRGVAADVDDDGALLLRTPSGVQRVVAGDVNPLS